MSLQCLMASVNWEIDNIVCFAIVYGSVYILGGVLFGVTNLEVVISWLAPSLTEKRFSVTSVRSEILLGG